MKFLENQQYIINDDGEISLALEAYRQYELLDGYQILYASDWKTDGDTIRKATEQRINELKYSSNQDLFDDLIERFSENLEVIITTEGKFDFFKLFDLMFQRPSK